MLSSRLALLFEVQGNVQTVQRNGGFDDDTTLSQGAALFAAQFWLIPQLWIKGGLGFSRLTVGDNTFTEDFGSGQRAAAGRRRRGVLGAQLRARDPGPPAVDVVQQLRRQPDVGDGRSRRQLVLSGRPRSKS